VEAVTVNFRQLKAEAKYLKDTCFWANGNYWSTRIPNLKRDRAKTGVKVAYLSKTEWFAFVFSKFKDSLRAIGVFRSLERGERWFYQEPVNQFKNFSVWCCSEGCFELVLEQLRVLPEIELEFVIPQTKHGLCVPAPFDVMGLQFYEVGSSCKSPKTLRLTN